MRIAPIVLWVLASLFWLPWFFLLARFLADLALGTPLASSPFFELALVPFGPGYRLSGWQVVSGFPVAALIGFALSALGWRISWIIRDGLLPRGRFLTGLSVVVPPLALLFAWQDARSEYEERNAELQAAAAEARERLSTEH